MKFNVKNDDVLVSKLQYTPYLTKGKKYKIVNVSGGFLLYLDNGDITPCSPCFIKDNFTIKKRGVII